MVGTTTGVNGTAPPTGTDNSFFGTITGAIGNTFAQALPVWTAKQLNLQSKDQLSAPLFVSSVSGQRQPNEGLQTTAQPPATAQRTLFDLSFGGTHVDSTTLILAAGAVIFGIFVIKRFA